MFRKLYILISFLILSNPVFAHGEINLDGSEVLILVGIEAKEIADHERDIFQGKKVFEIPKSSDWQNKITSMGASEVIVKQSTGFVGLYSASGFLIKPIVTNDQMMNPAGTNPGPSYPDPNQRLTYEEYVYNPYLTGGIPNPYALPPTAEPNNNARLAPGWGYNSQVNKPPSKRSVVMDFLNFVPIDTMTPLNYPGYFDQRNLTTAYGLGVIPHIGGLIARTRRAKADQSDYQYYKAQGPGDFIEYPVQYHTNPPARGPYVQEFVQDPNFYRYQQMPYSFDQSYPGYGQPNGGFSSIYNPAD